MRKFTSRSITNPTPGYYLLRLMPKGWEVPARLIESDGIYTCEIDGEPVPGEWTADTLAMAMGDWVTASDSNPIVRLIIWGKPCDEAAYQHRLAVKGWALQHQPAHPAANPREPINLRLAPLTEF